GDTLRIDVWGSIEGNYMAAVNRNGEIAVPRLGVINVWGQTFGQVRETIRRQIAKYFTNFEFNVSMGALRSIQVFMVGEVQSPGTYQVNSLSTVLTALSEAGGPAKTGTLRNIQLLREGKRVTTIDFYAFFLKGDKSKDVRLQSGDTIFVPIIGPVVAVAGNVRRPAIYELKDGLTLSQALDLAGGLIPTAYLQKVQVDRVRDHRITTVLDLDIGTSAKARDNLSLALMDWDRIRVAPIALAGGYVRLEGYVVRPGEYELSPGMRLSDLILPYDNLLPEFFPDLAQVIRMAPPEYQPLIQTVDLKKALDGDPDHNLLLREYDVVKLFSRKQMEELPQVAVSGAVLRPGTYRLYEKMTVRDLVATAGNLKRSAYLSQAEITRFLPMGLQTKTERHLIDLQKALEGIPEHDLALQVDDHLFVRSIPDYAEKYTVKIVGEVLFPGSYAIAKGEKLASVLERAGGYSQDAYLNGAFFTRESLKQSQRHQTNRLIAEQEQEIYRITSQLAAGAMGEEDVAASQAILESRQQLVQKLKQVPITGRMVIHLQALDQLAECPDNVELLDGDTLTIPRNPKTVTVLGQVYNPVSMAYNPGQTVGYYLDKVGGPRKNAETGEIYVVRADGSVFSKQQSGFGLKWDSTHKLWRGNSFYTTELFPGDTILVPEKVKRTDWMKEIKDITTILYQISLGAAVILSL
ncbi:MAG: polysaccharide biosynthesis protein, partial [Desulfatitalea sp.]|nr:SLBB domain-containing protein [Desulfatitalea sp.]NNK02602.1 polysaccharide biosynthesis protein [Desulfatitalea sp.]